MMEQHTKEELYEMIQDKCRILSIPEITEIVDTCWPIDYKDTFNVPEGEALCFRGGGILVNGKNDVPGLKALGEKEKTCKLFLRRSKLNRILTGETDCLNKPLTPEVIGQFKRERDLIQEGILKTVEPLLNPNSTNPQPSDETAENGGVKQNNYEITLPEGLDTEKARKAFGKALEAGYLEKTSNGYKWKVLPHAAAAYLCEKIYCPNIKDKAPNWGLLGQFLGILRLDQSAYRNKGTKSTRPWRQNIDKLFED